MGTIVGLAKAEDGRIIEPVDGRREIPIHAAEEVWIDAGAGLLVERSIGCRHTPTGPDDELPYGIEMWADYSEESGRYEVASLQATRIPGGPPLTSDALRSIPVARFLRGLKGEVFWGRAADPDHISWFVDLPDKRSFPRGTLDDEAYRDIALVHRAHEVLGTRATSLTAKHFGVTTTTVQNWMKEARARGLTDPIWRPNK